MTDAARTDDPWNLERMKQDRDLIYRELSTGSDVLPGEMVASVDFLRPLWNTCSSDVQRNEIIRLYVGSYSFPHAKSMYAAMKNTGIDMDIVSQVTPDKKSMSVQLLVEAGFWGEGYELMEKRCSTLNSVSMGLDKYFVQKRLEMEAGEEYL